MKLELKHIAPYLPYEVKVSKLHFLNIRNGIGSIEHILTTKNEDYKLYLRPLSDLTKEIEVNGKKFVPIVEINVEGEPFVEYGVNGYGKDYLCFNYADGDDSIGFNDYEKLRSKLFEWHFDVFGLIEQGLAIDFNTLEK